MIIPLPAFAAQGNQTGAPSSYVSDTFVSNYYTVSLLPGWSYPSAPSSGVITFWSFKGGKDCVVGVLTLPATVGQGATVNIPGNSGSLAATIVMTGGSTPTFTGSLLVDGQYGIANFAL